MSVTRWWEGGDNAILPEQPQATQTVRKRGDSHQSGARCVGRIRFAFQEHQQVL